MSRQHGVFTKAHEFLFTAMFLNLITTTDVRHELILVNANVMRNKVASAINACVYVILSPHRLMRQYFLYYRFFNVFFVPLTIIAVL